MTYKEMKKNDSFTKLIEDLLKKSNRRFTGEKCEYKDLSVTERVNYIDSSLCTVLRWMDVIFKRPEKCGDEYWDKDALKDERTYPILDEYGDWKTMENRETAIDDLYKIVRMYIYILERFFMDGNSAVKDDYIAVVGLFKKMATDNSLDFYESHRRVEELYFLIHEKHDLEQYFDYEGIEILSEKLPDIDSKNIRYQYVGLKDIEEKRLIKT